MALSIGLQIRCRNYDLDENVKGNAADNNSENENLPFLVTDIVEINPIVKHLDISSDDVQANMEIVNLILLL